MQKSFRWFFLLFFISGFPALIYQIVWQRLPQDRPLGAEEACPANHYALTKLWAEQMGEMYLAATREAHEDAVLVRLKPERWLTADFARFGT